LVDAPSVAQDEVKPLTLSQAQQIIDLSTDRRNGTRWSIALALGLRQGEALGLRWEYVDLDAGSLTVRWQLQRLAWRHGCRDPHVCGKDRHRDDCPPGCTAHARACPIRAADWCSR
jgi:integrase